MRYGFQLYSLVSVSVYIYYLISLSFVFPF